MQRHAPCPSVAAAAWLAALLLVAAPVPLQAQSVLRRDWWFRAPGGNYGLMEVRTSSPAASTSRTTVLLGPWRRTFDATAPQILAVVIIPALVTAFTWGWIKTRRR